MQAARLFLTKSYWKSAFKFKDLGKGVFGTFGSIYVASKVVDFAAPELQKEIGLLPLWFRVTVIVLVVLAGAAWAIWPRYRVSSKLAGRDVLVSVEVGDLFTTNSALVISTNRTFDTWLDDKCISRTSAQGQFTMRYYDKESHLDKDIEDSLHGVPFQVNETKTLGKKSEYPIGTTAMVRPKQKRRAYLLAIAQMSNHGRASGTLEDLLSALGSLWVFIGQRGDIEPLRIPVLGTGYSRLTAERSEIIQEILKSFIAACSERRFCDSLTVVIAYADYRKYNIDLEELGRYLVHVCKYADFKRPEQQGAGQALPPDGGTIPPVAQGVS